MNNIEQLVELLKGHRTFIQTHNFPDPDAIASAFGLRELLREYDIDSTIVYEGTPDKISGLRMVNALGIDLYEIHDITDMSESDYIVIVDAQKYNKNCTDFIGDEVACIDHHPVFEECEYKYKDIRTVGACASIIASYYIEAGIIPTVSVATALIFGSKIDTNEFSRGVTEFDVEMYFKLFKYADKNTLQKLQLNSICFEDLRAYGAAINTISLYKNIGFGVIPFDCPDGLIGVISDFLLALDVVDVCVVYSVRDSGYKFSIRSEIESVDAGKVINSVMKKCGDGSGGGHAFMAGGFLPNDSIESLGEHIRETLEMMFIKEIYPTIDVSADDIRR